jgi:hypothetical protein
MAYDRWGQGKGDTRNPNPSQFFPHPRAAVAPKGRNRPPPHVVVALHRISPPSLSTAARSQSLSTAARPRRSPPQSHHRLHPLCRRPAAALHNIEGRPRHPMHAHSSNNAVQRDLPLLVDSSGGDGVHRPRRGARCYRAPTWSGACRRPRTSTG